MNSLPRENPFLRHQNFTHNYLSPRQKLYKQEQPTETDWNSSRMSRAVMDNPFEKSRYDQVFAKKKPSSRAKSQSQYNSGSTFLPLSRYQNRLRLRELDTELWKREIDREERQKLQYYGPEALRYSTLNSSRVSYHSNDKNFRIGREEEQRKLSRKLSNYGNNGNPKQYNSSNDQHSKQRNLYYESLSNNFNSNHNQYTPEKIRQKDHKNESKLQKQNSYGSQRRSQQKQESGYFRQAKDQYYQSSQKKINQNQNYKEIKKLNSNTFGDRDDSDFFQHLQGRPSKQQQGDYNRAAIMSYGSNFGGGSIEKKNFYDSDYVNLEDHQNNEAKGPLNAMRFSSSFDSETTPVVRDYKKSSFGKKPHSHPSFIQYNGREFFQLSLLQ